MSILTDEEGNAAQVYPSIMPPIPDSPTQDFFRFRIDGSDIIDEVLHQLKGEMFVSNKGWEAKFDRWMNDEGINKIIHIIYSCGINKNVFLGNLTKEEILYKCKMIKKKLALLLFQKHKEYQIPLEMRSLLITTVVNTIHSGLSRCEGGLEARQLSTATQRHEIFNEQARKDESLMSRVNPLRKLMGR